jgi:hypothetical protein
MLPQTNNQANKWPMLSINCVFLSVYRPPWETYYLVWFISSIPQCWGAFSNFFIAYRNVCIWISLILLQEDSQLLLDRVTPHSCWKVLYTRCAFPRSNHHQHGASSLLDLSASANHLSVGISYGARFQTVHTFFLPKTSHTLLLSFQSHQYSLVIGLSLRQATIPLDQ